MGFLPRDPLFRDDTKGGARPPLETPAYEETYPEFLRILPWVRHKNHVPTSTSRNMYPFKRPTGGVSLTARLQIR